MGTPSSNQYFEALWSGTGTPASPNLFTAAELVAGSFDSAAISTATSTAVSTVNAAAPDSTSISQARSQAVSAATNASTADSKAVSDATVTSVADSKALSVSVNASIADSKAESAVIVASRASSTLQTAISLSPGVPFPLLSGETGVTNLTYTYGDLRRYGFSTSNTGSANLTAFQAAANSLPATHRLTLPDGSYTVSGETTVTTSGVYINLGKATITQSGTFKSTLILSGVSDVEIASGTFVGKGTEHSGVNTAFNGVAAISMRNGCSNISIHGIKATNHAGGSIRWDTNITGLRVYDCKLVGIGAAGGIAAGDNNDDVAIGGYATNPDNDVQIWGNDISGHCFGIQVAYGKGCLIENNDIHDIPGQHGIYNAQQSEVQIIGNRFKTIAYIGVKNQIADASTICTDIQVNDNEFDTCGQTAISTQCVNFTSSYYNVVQVQGNQIRNCGAGYGIQADYVREYDCKLNEILTVTGGPGISLAHGYGQIKGNTIKSTSWNAITCSSLNHDTEISGNTIVDGCLNTEVGVDSNNYRYLIFLQKDAASLVTNPKALVFDNTFRATTSEGTFYLAAVFAATGTYLYYYGANKNLTSKTAIVMQTTTDLQQCDVVANITPTYGTSVNFDRSLGNTFNIVVTNSTGFTMQPPTNSTPGIFHIRIKNSSGGATGTNAFAGAFHTTGAWTAPANGFHRTITFYYDGSVIGEIGRSTADVAN